MYLTHTLAPPFLDADRRGGNAPNGRWLTARTVIVVAYVVFVAAWLVARLNGYWR